MNFMLKNFLFCVMLLSHFSLFADTAQIESLEKQRWEYIKDKKWDDLESMVAPYFQLGFYDGGRNKEQFLNLARSADLSDYKLSNFKITEGPGIAVVTYDVDVSETIGGKRISSKASRLSVWHNNKDKWQLAAHAILIPVPPSPEQK